MDFVSLIKAQIFDRVVSSASWLNTDQEITMYCIQTRLVLSKILSRIRSKPSILYVLVQICTVYRVRELETAHILYFVFNFRTKVTRYFSYFRRLPKVSASLWSDFFFGPGFHPPRSSVWFSSNLPKARRSSTKIDNKRKWNTNNYGD